MEKNTINCDMVVIGAGGSGLVAAVKAAELSNRKVIVLEKAKKPGGCTNFAHAFQIENSKWHKEAGIPDTSEDAFRQMMKHLNWDVNPKIIRNYVDTAGPFFDWLVEKGGAEELFTKPKPDITPDANGVLRRGGISFPDRNLNKDSRDPTIGPGWMGSYVVNKMIEQCDRLGIQILTETRAREFLTDRNGLVSGVLADTEAGRIKVNCEACIIAAGGFGAGLSKLKKRWPEVFEGNTCHIFSVPTNEGDSLDMAERIGAHVDYKKIYGQIGGPAHHPYSYSIFLMMVQPEVVNINLRGERWIDEAVSVQIPGGPWQALIRQPKAEMYSIADYDLVEMLGERIVANQTEESEIKILKGFREDIAYEAALDERGAKGTHTKKADTLEELADKMGVDPTTFVATIDKYNRYCQNGRDLDFLKKSEYLKPIRKPPFYAFFGQLFCESTHGGIVVNENMEVLDVKGKAMPGLFAAGDNTGGMTIDGAAPGELTWAVRSGFMAGIAAAKYIEKA